MILPLVPLPLREAISRLLHIDPEKRPTIQVLSMIKYFQYVIFILTFSFIHISRISFTHFFSKKEKKYLELILFFRDPPVYALQFLDVSKMKDALQKEHFYTTTLKGILPYIPRVILYLYTR